MPRGVYDRSLTKEQRAKNKSAKASAKGAAPKRKYTRRAVSGESMVGTTKMSSNPDGAFVLLGEIRQNLGTLTMVRGQFGDLPSLTSEVDAQVAALGLLREKLFTQEDLPSDQPAEETVEEEAVVPAANGVAPALQTVVPLPPPPINPVIPAPH